VKHATTVIVVVIFAQRTWGSIAGARRSKEAKWFVPDVLGMAGDWIFLSE
jgi:hypothetical protein